MPTAGLGFRGQRIWFAFDELASLLTGPDPAEATPTAIPLIAATRNARM
jgi:hypothetical protein